MKIVSKIFLVFFLLILSFVIYIYSSFNSKNPRDLGIKYTEEDLTSGRGKSQVVYEEVKKEINGAFWQTSGKREVNTTFSSSEITAIMNNKPGVYFPYKDVQLKFNADGTGEISGKLIKSRIPVYASTFDAPKVAVDFVMKFLPEDPVFYLKGKATLVNNEVGIFEPMKLEIGRVSIPLGPILSFNKDSSQVYAMDLSGMMSELSKVENKKSLIIDFINSRLSVIEGFYAKNAYFEENKLVYEGTLPEKEITAR